MTKKKHVPDRSLLAIMNDLQNFKIRSLHLTSEITDSVNEFKKDIVRLLIYFPAILDLLSEISNIPKAKLLQRFLEYCQQYQIIDASGEINGTISVSRYNYKEVQ